MALNKPRSSVSAQQHRNASFFANYASKWASTSTVRRSSTKTAKLLSLSLKRHASESAQHIALRWHFIAERQDPQVADLKVIHRRRTKMLAEIFASPRAAPTFIAFRDHILGLRSAFVADDDEV